MKKLIFYFIIFLIIMTGIVIFTYGKEFLTLLDEKKVYNVENIQTTKIDTLEEYEFFNKGIVTYNNQKIIFFDYKNNSLWQNEDGSFSKKVFVTDNNIFRSMEDTIQVLDKNNQKFVISEIQGDLVNVSRENDKVYMIVKNNLGNNALYVLNSNNEVIVDNKIFDDNITGVSISDKSEGYAIITMRFENDTIINTIYFNLLDDVELWSSELKNEILIKVQLISNNVVAIGTKNIYYFNNNGKLMWKNGIYNKILNYSISKENQQIYILYENGSDIELISYNFEGKVTGVYKAPTGVNKLKVYGDRVFVYNKYSIYLIHGLKTDKIYEDTEGIISDFLVENNDIHILCKDKLVKGQIK